MINIPNRLRKAGQLLSNCAFNLSQNQGLDEHTRGLLKNLQKEWDAALAEIREKNRISKTLKRKICHGPSARGSDDLTGIGVNKDITGADNEVGIKIEGFKIWPNEDGGI